MRIKHLLWIGAAILLVATQWPVKTGAQAADVKADYDRSAALNQKVQGKIYYQAEGPNWISPTKFWYRRTVKGGNDFTLVDAAAATKAPAFDHGKLAASLSTA